MIVGRIVGELCVVAVTFAHEDVDLARLQDPIESWQLSEVDFQGVRAALLPVLLSVTLVVLLIIIPVSGRLFERCNEDIFRLRCRSALIPPVVMLVRFNMTLDPASGFIFGAAFESKLTAEAPLTE